MHRRLVWLLLAALLSTSVAQPVRSVFALDAATPHAASRSLARSTPERQGISSADIFDFVDAADKQIDTMNSFMFVRHGYVVAEGWWSPYDAATAHRRPVFGPGALAPTR